MTLSRAGAFLLGVALILGGCGSSTLSSKQLLSSATQICQNANRKAARIAVPASPAQAQAFLARGITTLTPELEQLKQLRPERSEAATFHAAVDALSRELLELRRTQQRLRHDADPVAAMESLQGRLGPLRAEGDTRWRQLGISACVSR